MKFEFRPHGSCLVSCEHGRWDWSKEHVIQACEVAKVCMESRQGPPCNCTACQLYVAYRDWKDNVPKFILHPSSVETRNRTDPNYNDKPRMDEDGKIIGEGAIGRVTADNVYLTSYPEWPKGAKRLADLEVGEFIRAVRYSLSGSVGYYDIYRVQ